jgi:cysteinyl-tRNA synthetase
MEKPSKLIVYNTLSRKEEEFMPMKKGHVGMFVCGQTVYDDAHLGHAKNYINFDIIVRWLRHIGYEVRYVQNITDVDDKIIASAKEKGEEPLALARHFEKRFFEDMDAIGVRKNVDMYPRSHDYIGAIGEQIQLLLDKGYAYPLDGDIYYNVAKFKEYTELSGVTIDDLEKHRIEPKKGKINVYDFALWKAAKQGEPSWKIKISYKGKEAELDGRPGWHIEDTAMTWKILGEQYDMHGGAKELIFPHHTNEIAQSEAAFGKRPFVRYWIHTGVLKVNGEKMSKSLKNFITIRELLKKHSAEALRLLVASTQYSNEINYTDKLMAEAEKRLRYIYAAFSIFYNMNTSKENDEGADAIIERLEKDFADAMDNDFNTPLALMKLSSAIDGLRQFAEMNKKIDEKTKKRAVGRILELVGIFGILQTDTYKEKLPAEAGELIKKREELRKAKDFGESDRIRSLLRQRYGIIVEDSDYGPIWYRDSE